MRPEREASSTRPLPLPSPHSARSASPLFLLAPYLPARECSQDIGYLYERVHILMPFVGPLHQGLGCGVKFTFTMKTAMTQP